MVEHRAYVSDPRRFSSGSEHEISAKVRLPHHPHAAGEEYRPQRFVKRIECGQRLLALAALHPSRAPEAASEAQEMCEFHLAGAQATAGNKRLAS